MTVRRSSGIVSASVRHGRPPGRSGPDADASAPAQHSPTRSTSSPRESTTRPPRAGDGRPRFGVKTLRPNPAVARLDGRIVAAPVGHAQQLEDVAVFSAPLDRYTERGHEGQPGQPQDVRPSRPDACLVDERLADIETDPPRHQMSRSSRPAPAKAPG